MQAEIVSVGTELLLGNIVDTNAAHIARELAVYGVDVFHQSTVGDNPRRGAETIRVALERADAVIVTGGIGPTPDDATREAVAVALGVDLERRPELVERLRERYATRGRIPTEASYKQADLPVGATAIDNPTGSAVGVLAVAGSKTIYALPGVPSEMVRMLDETVLPDLRERYGLTTGLFTHVLRSRGIGESDIADRLGDLLTDSRNPTVATYVKTGEVEVRLTARANDADEAATMFAPLEQTVRERIGEYIYAVNGEGYEVQVGRLLVERGWQMASAESCTGGRLGDRITAVPGSSRYYRGGVVAYDNAVKTGLLGVPVELIERHGAVSAACAEAMAVGVCGQLDADVGVSTTGIAGPDGGLPDKPVGLVYIAVAQRDGDVVVEEHRLRGERDVVKERAALAALEMACRRIAGSYR